MEAQAALAFVARRAGAQSMPASRWGHVMSLELGWMAPGLAKQYIAACEAAGLLQPDGDALRLAFDPRSIDVPRGFRPNPDDLPAGGPSRPAVANPVSTSPTHAAAAAPSQAAPTREAVATAADPEPRPAPADTVGPSASPGAQPGATQAAAGVDSEEDTFAAWLPRVAAARGEDIGATMAAMEAMQENAGGLLFAEAAILVLGAQAGLDVAAAAGQALKALQA